MLQSRRRAIVLALFALAVIAGSDVRTAADGQAPIPPLNDVPNPYTTIKDFFKLPAGRTWGSTSAVDVDIDGKSIWVGERCGANTCFDPATNGIQNVPTILKFDTNGHLVKAFGEGMLIFAHGIHVDREGNVWVTDGQDNAPRAARGAPPPQVPAPAGPNPAATKGHQVFKFSPDGKLLMTLGKPGGGRDAEYFYQPNDVHVSPNGDIFVSEGHSSTPGSIARVLKFDKTGKLIKTWGTWGNADGEFDQPHAIAMDSIGRLYIGDRNNNRIQIFDQNGTFLHKWYQFSRPSGLYIDKNDLLYVADSESMSISRNHDGWKRGIRIGNSMDGRVTAFIPDPDEKATGTSAAEGVVVDSMGNVYGAEVGPKGVKKYVIGQ